MQRTFVCLLVVVTLAAAVPCAGAGDDTLALWLFDDPAYLNVTLTDAGTRHYDLRLYTAGVLGPGRFGRAVGRDPHKPGQAVSFAETPQHFANDWQGALKSRPATPPAEMLRCLATSDWTWEFHIKQVSPPADEACLVDAGRQAFYCALSPRAERLVVRSAAAGFDRAIPLGGKLSAGRWHHVALVWRKAASQLACFIDGQPCGEATPIAPAVRSWTNGVEGLRGCIYGDSAMTRPSSEEVTPQLDCRFGKARGVDWAERWTGDIAFPVSGRVRFRAEASGTVRMKIGATEVFAPPEKSEKRRPPTGEITVVADKPYTIVVEFVHRGDNARLRLFWSWQGEAEQIVPAAAFSHIPKGTSGYRFDLSLVGDQQGKAPCAAWLDEMRVSRGALYRQAFTPPGTFSRHATAGQPGATAGQSGATAGSSSSAGGTVGQATRGTPARLPLLFGDGPPREPVALGSRKHVFWDDVMIARRNRVASSQDVVVRQIPPARIERTEFPGSVGDATIVDDGTAIRLYHGGWNDCNRLATAADGLAFRPVDTHVGHWGDQTNLSADAVLRLPGQASFFLDGNPAALPNERYKGIAWIMTRGIYGITSADGVHWRRGETTLLPFDCGGGVEGYWDDQREAYVCHIRHEGHYARSGDNQRLAARAESRQFAGPWPFTPDPHPVPRKALTLPALWKELPTPFVPHSGGQVYRTRAMKYPWAPDAYVAFVWRYDVPRDLRSTELATSRDGRTWKFFGTTPAYIPIGLKFDGDRVARAALSVLGLARRGDAIWQYATLDTRGHNEPHGYASLQRLTQRLDGFACLAADGPGWLETRPLIFAGRRLELNVAARGSLRVALLDESGKSIPGFTINDCQPIRADSVRQTVAWTGGNDVSQLAGKPIRLRFEMNDARLFAMQFVP